MRKYPSDFRVAQAAIMGAAIYLGVACGIASAQDTATTNVATVPPPPAVRVAPASPTTQPPALPYGVGEVVKMYQGGINKDIIVNYINNTSLPYHLSADGILYLQTLGMPQEITKAMILRDGQMQQQTAQQFYAQQPPPQQPMPPPNGAVADQPPVQVVTPSTPPPTPTVIGGDDYPVYDYGYPYYYGGWPYYYGGPVVIGGGWGWGHGGFHGGGGFRGGGFGGGHGGFGGGHGGGGHR